MVWVAELINQPLTSLGLLHDPFLVVLPQRTRQLVVVHRWSVLRKESLYRNRSTGLLMTVKDWDSKDGILKFYHSSHLSLPPQRGDLDRVDDLEDPLLPVDPVDVVAIEGGLQQELLDELPEVDVRARPWRALLRLSLLILLIWRVGVSKERVCLQVTVWSSSLSYLHKPLPTDQAVCVLYILMMHQYAGRECTNMDKPLVAMPSSSKWPDKSMFAAGFVSVLFRRKCTNMDKPLSCVGHYCDGACVIKLTR